VFNCSLNVGTKLTQKLQSPWHLKYINYKKENHKTRADVGGEIDVVVVELVSRVYLKLRNAKSDEGREATADSFVV